MATRAPNTSVPAGKLASPFAAMLLGTTLSDGEVFASMECELESERAACHAAMNEVIREAAKKVVRLSSDIFGGFDNIRSHSETCLAAINRHARSVGDDPTILWGLRRIYDRLKLELSVAERLREIRATVAHADPADYWQKKAADWADAQWFGRVEGEA